MMHFPSETAFTRVRDALAWRLHRLLGDRVVYGTLLASAARWRRMLTGTVFIGVTGSAGKTTTKELLVGMLSHKRRGVGNRGSYNNTEEIAMAMLHLRPHHGFFVTELSGHNPNEMDRPLALVRPSIGIVTVIGDDHSSIDYSREAIAREKSKLIAALPATGTAILNADDALVLAMAGKCAGKVITYGVSPDAELRALDITSVWPDRLELTLARGSRRLKVRTRLCGSHWVPSVLGAIGGGLAFGMTLDECAEAIARVEPFDGRMQPMTTPEGVTFIRDDFKAPMWTVDACFEFMRTARAKRKIIVIGELQDIDSQKGATYAKTAILAQEIADITIFVGPWASSALKARKPGREDALCVFGHVRHAAEYVNSITREGDLVLLKGANKQDHLLRVILARDGRVACWRDDCNRYSFCNECPDRNRPSGVPSSKGGASIPGATPLVPLSGQRIVDPEEQVIVGLGNPESKYFDTPHNVGYKVVDRLAATLGLTWTTTPEAWVARGSLRGRSVCLLKIRTAMNDTGAELKRVSGRMSFAPEQCILVYDDLDMPIGSIRTRLNGGAGGHRGIASILEAFQTDAIRRVKVGVGQAGTKRSRAEYVLTALDAESRTAIDTSILAAETRTIELVDTAGVPQRQ